MKKPEKEGSATVGENRAILLTPPEPAAIAVVRLTGEKTAVFLRDYFSVKSRALAQSNASLLPSPGTPGEGQGGGSAQSRFDVERESTPTLTLPPSTRGGDKRAGLFSEAIALNGDPRAMPTGRPIHGELTDNGKIIDDPLLVLHDGGLVADLSIHGGPWVVRQVLELARKCGFEILERLEAPLPPDAIDATDELDQLIQSNLPLAKTELALRWLLSLRASVFPSQSSVLSPRHSLWHLLHPPAVAIVGPPNAGKSTLANQLFAQQRSITADQPGTTRDWVGEIADIDGLAVFLMDTPGLRHSDDSIEQAAIAQSAQPIKQADLIVLVLDGTDSTATQREWAMRFPDALVVRNKCDRATQPAALDACRPHIHTVATTGEGVDHLRQAIRRHFIRIWQQP